MAAPRENLLSLEHLTGTDRNTFTKQREHRLKKSVNRPLLLQADFPTSQSHQQLAMHLQQRWQELKERELTARQHNRQLLWQFEEAQNALREMLTLNAAMKTIRVEYERYLEESSPRWQQQLKEKTQAAQRKRMEEYLRSCLKNTEERVTASSADRPLLLQGSTTRPQTNAAPPKHYSPNSHLDYNQDGYPHRSYMQSSYQTHPQSQMARFPIRAPHQPQGSSHVPPSFLQPRIFPHPHSFQLHHLASAPGDHHPRPRQNPPGWASLQPDYPWSWAAGSEALWGQLYTEEPPPEMGVAQVAGEETDTSRAPSSKRERGGGGRSSHSSQELDIKPVRLPGGLAESSESSRESGQVSREKRKKREERGRSHCSSSDRESCSSQESSRYSTVIAAVTVAQSSESDASSKGRTSTSRRTRRSGGLAVGSPRAEKVAKESKGEDSGSHKEESRSTSEELGSLIKESRSEKAENQSPDDKSESCGEESGSQREEESGSVSIKIENRGGDVIEKQESGSSEQSSVGEKDEEDLGDDDGDAEEKENSQTDEEQEERDVEEEDDEASERKITTEEEEETGAEDEVEEQESGVKGDRQSDRLKSEEGENGEKCSASSQDEEVKEDDSEGGEDNMEDGESDEEEQRGDLAGEPEEERDSDDSIISPQDKCKKMHIIPEEVSEEDDDEEEEGSKTGSSDDDSNEFSDKDDVEHLLAPQDQSQKKEEKDLRADEKPKANCDNVEIFKVEPEKTTKSDHPSDSDEFDHFYG